MELLIFVIISFLASTIGAVCGIGGGVIIKPTLDAFGILSIPTISFLSGGTVFAMSCYSVLKNREQKIKAENSNKLQLLAIGASVGGIVGKELFQFVAGLFADVNRIAAIQAILLILLTIGTLIYTLKKSEINTKKVSNGYIVVIIGLLLGGISSFLGIGGGPINLVVLYYFFSMETKAAVKASLYIIMFSQGASLISTILLNRVPEFEWLLMGAMVFAGILGAWMGHKINKKISSETVHFLFIVLMIGIIVINIFNVTKYL